MAGFHAAHRGAGNLALEALLLRQRYGTVEAAFDIGARHAAEVFLRNLGGPEHRRQRVDAADVRRRDTDVVFAAIRVKSVPEVIPVGDVDGGARL